MTHPPSISNRLDLRIILLTPLTQFVWWLAAVVLVSAAGYPGVVCVTPMAWLLALRVGILCTARSRSEPSSRRVLEAALAGAFLGLSQGILFLVILPFLGPYQSDEVTRTVILTVILLFVGILAGAGLSFFTAYLSEQRKKRITEERQNV